LGPEGTSDLVGVLDLAEREWREDVLSLAGERFERRLAESHSSLRVQIAQSETAIRGEMAQMEVRIVREIANCRGELTSEIANCRSELTSEIAKGRGDLIKWSFLFWIGQVVAMSAVMGAMLRTIR
jgi:hypothetical protein